MVVIKGYKIRLLPTLEQEMIIRKSIGVSRFVYNWCLDKQLKSDKFIRDNELRKELTRLKRTDSHHWLNEVGCNVIKQSAKDLCNAYKKFLKGLAGKPRFKKKGISNSFYVNYETMKKTKHGVRCEKIGDIKTSERLPKLTSNSHYTNPHIVFDGKYHYITFGMEINIEPKENTSNIIGIDLGIKSFAVCSDGTIYKNINKTHTVKKLNKKLRRLQRCISKRYIKDKIGDKFIKTMNIVKLEHKIKLIHRRIKNIRENYIHQITTNLVKAKPSRIVVEDLNIKGMLKNKQLSKAIAEQCFYKFIRVLGYKCDWNNIELLKADRFYPSSKKCSCCGSIKKDLKLKDRTYKCSSCGLVIDRDFNASLNLANYKLA